MKLLFDANSLAEASEAAVRFVPGSTHLFDLPLPRNAADIEIWTYAKENGFNIITADGDDYPPLARRFGPPPKLLVLESWRYPTQITSSLIRRNAVRIVEFEKSDRTILVLCIADLYSN